ncbi:MAG: hypothetical protein HY276_07260 [Ignavibacteriales bacterium]|nr:hypothetical protein [Ignavibacteriales bacterium]MBI3788038.1 hypothetical protein [Ignavibacteriales bacterium]
MRSKVLYIALMSFLALPLFGNTFTVKAVKGIVEVRRDVKEEWKRVKVGDVLKPEDSMRTGKSSSATIVSDAKRLTVPELSIIDLSDVRELSQKDFLLKLAMENILAVPQRDRDSIMIPTATVLHGADNGKEDAAMESSVETGLMQLQGTKVLFDNAFYATSVLKSKETLRKYPELKANYDTRLMIAQAFEKLRLVNEAITEYSMLTKEELPSPLAKKVQTSLQRLKQAK